MRYLGFLLLRGGMLLGATLAPSLGTAQSVSSTTLVSRGAAVDATFTHVSAARELSRDRVLVLDSGEQRVWLIDLAHRTRTQAGGSGLGALEYDSPTMMIGTGANTVVEDFKGPKMLVFDKTGTPTESFALASTGATRVSRGLLDFRGGDDVGRLYFEVPGVVVEHTGARAVDSAAILRVDRRAPRIDTVTFIHLPAGATKASGGMPGEGLSITTGGDNPFSMHDTWVSAPNGHVAIVHAQPYRVEWVSPDGKRTLGPVIDVERIPVTDADIAEHAKRTGGGVGVGGGLGPRSDAPPTQSARGGRDDWPVTKAPFVHFGALIDPHGNVWVRRMTRAGDPRAPYDVFDGTGQLIGRYTLPDRTRLVGFGAANLFAIHQTDDGERLEIFRVR
jgi:hypothetical protein